ncbi:MAG TPA: hypothetical protein VGJ28_15525 [Micromonosporaceae bacterium]|jgi:hypothetical protein
MSVFMVLHVPGNPASLEKYAAGPGADIIKRVSAAGKAAGAIRHSFAGSDNEIVVIDEWPDEKSFQAFFDSQPDIPNIMREGGAQGQPKVSFYRKLNTMDSF